MYRRSLLVLILATPAIAQSERDERTLRIQQQKHEELREDFRKELERVAAWCEDNGMVEAAGRTRQLAQPPGDGTLSEARLPRAVQPVIPPGAVDTQRLWYGKLATAQKGYARELYRLSRTVLRLGYPSYAMQLVQEVALHDPDNKNARRLLGFVLFQDKRRADERDYRGEWVTPFEAKMLGGSKRRVWSEWGWVPEADLPKYQQGLRPWKGAWVSAEKEAEIRRDFRNAWEVETEHFLVKTNYSLERGVEIASQLEDYYAFFRRTFAAFFETPEELQKRFTGSGRRRGRPAAPRQMEVHYYRTKDEYVQRLIRKIPQIAMTEGLYYEQDKTSYFFHNPSRENDGTLFHEATHQFFDVPTAQHRADAARIRARALNQRTYHNWVIGEKSNFWMVEAIACYMESFEPTPTGNRLGNPDYLRFRAAHYRLTESDFYMPLREFTKMGIRDFQSHSSIAMLYTQASGLAHFLMHYDNGRYRDALISFIAQLYRPDLKNTLAEPSLERLTGVSYEELDRQYKDYMSGLYGRDAKAAAGSGD